MTSSENGLKLIAIKPLNGCNIKHLKNLKTETIYPLCNNYSITTNSDGEETVLFAENTYPDIYSIGDMKVNVCAIVGKNGTGKSSLIELFFAALYNISKAVDLIRGNDSDNNPYKRERNVNVAIYYSINCDIYKVELIQARIALYRYSQESGCIQSHE